MLAVLMLLAAACAGSTPDDGQAGGDGGDGEGGEGITWAIARNDEPTHQAVADLWNEANPDSPVTLELLPPEADGQREQMFLELNAQGDAFDVLALDVIWTGEFAEAGYLENLEDLRGEVEGASLDGPLESAGYAGELWALPYSTNVGFLYYRTDLVDEPPATWDEAMEAGMAAAEEEGISAYVGQGAEYEGLVVNFLEYFWGAGGELFSDDQSEALFAEGDAATTALEFMQTAQSEGFYAPGFDQAVEDDARLAFQNGDAVFMRNWPYAYGLLSGDDDEQESAVADSFDIAPLPTFTGDGTISALGGLNNAVSAFSSNTELAKEFIVWAATDPGAQGVLAESLAPPPTLAAAYEGLDDPVAQQIFESLQDARARPPVPAYNEFSVTVQQEVFGVYSGGNDPAAGVEAIQSAADQATVQE
ncbi:MAG: ABC transporter substrate-binding protein [Egibacteraceae bacterium]